ncbi:hypothetical protein PHYSODRAFT_331036 [Phytophthora sojae]|uniref:Uncharacterized protein n=1 Tax=Phytophthora sojae (strain P6497) TaxID=1094619 RepID=G4ZET5_PHYSP|nr:hypothetical protein PHYSODRAFT_331036 [Phytophthora sojae]EGZ16999.1 hypothetical protein PHYSODRAFT_331036 [Phytophthora sojae]|eukprot:XP_009526057.1 hypothetical protein PHYSODRAFT_331036 [Phytophthora sojae]
MSLSPNGVTDARPGALLPTNVTLGCALFASDSRGDKRKVEVGAAYGHAEKEKERARRKWRPRRRRADEAADEVTHAAHPEKLNGERYRCSTPKNGCEEDGVRNGNAGRTRLDGVHTGDAWRHWNWNEDWNWNRNWTEARVDFASATKCVPEQELAQPIITIGGNRLAVVLKQFAAQLRTLGLAD